MRTGLAPQPFPRRLLAIGAGSALTTALRSCGVPFQSASWDVALTEPRTLSHADILVPYVASPDGRDLLTLLSHLARIPRRAALLAVLADGAEPAALESAAAAADDFLIWRDGGACELRHRLRRMLDVAAASPRAESLAENAALANLIGANEQFVAMRVRLSTIARATGTVLLRGETGTGKELCARAIHHLSARRHQPFVPVDCGSLPDQLLENELFGHARGAFTDAHRDQAGLLAMADHGTLFLDEINSLPAPAQSRLLRFLEHRTYKPLGSERFLSSDVRIVAASNADLEALVAEKRFRADLYFRLNVLPVTIPPLRDRRDDIPLLVEHFANQTCLENGLPRKTFVKATLEALSQGDWPGNVRELLNTVQRAVTLTEGPLVLPHHLDADGAPTADGWPATVEEGPVAPFSDAKARALQHFEHSYVIALLRRHDGNISRAAAEAQKDRRAFGRLVKKYRINRLAV